MATFEELANGYAQRLRSARDGPAEARAIARDIQGLVYAGSQQPLSDAEISRLLDLIRDRAPAQKTALEGGRVRVIKEADNKNYLALVALVNGVLNG